MTDLLSLTEQLENAYFLQSNGYPNNSPPKGGVTIPFYVDSQNQLNFGYGLLITKSNLSVAGGYLLAVGVPQATINVIAQYFSGNTTVQDINNSLPNMDWRSAADVATTNFYTDVVDPYLIKSLGQAFYNLTGSAQEALKLLYYNSGSSFLGATLRHDLSTLDYVDAAYQLALNTAQASNTAYSDRALLGAALILGFDPGINASNSINSLVATSDTNFDAVINFLTYSAEKNPSDSGGKSYFKTPPVLSFFSQLEVYAIRQGVYVVEPYDVAASGGAAASIAAQVNSVNADTNGFNYIAAATLVRINSVFSDTSDFNVGGLIHVPVAVLALTTQPTALTSLSGNYTYVLDPQTNSLYTVAASLDGSNANELLIDSTGKAIPLNLIDTISASATGPVLGLVDGIEQYSSISIGLNDAGNGFAVSDDGMGQPEATAVNVNPIGGALVSLVDSSNGFVQADLSMQVAGDPAAILADPDGTIELGLDPPIFQPAVEFAANGGITDADNVEVSVTGGQLVFNIQIGDGETLEISSTSAVSSVVTEFTFGEGGTLTLDDPTSFTGTIVNFQPGDVLDLAGIDASSNDETATLGQNGVLSIYDDSGMLATLQLDPDGNYSGETFSILGTGETVLLAEGLSSASGDGGTTTVQSAVIDTVTGLPYDVSVGASQTDFQFAPERTNDLSYPSTNVTFTYLSGDLDPNDDPNPVNIESDSGQFSVSAALSQDSTTQTVGVQSFEYEAGVYTDVPVPVEVDYDGGSSDFIFTASQAVYAPAIASFSGQDGFFFLHVGQTISTGVTITNSATGSLTDSLVTSPGTQGAYTALNGLTLAAGESGVVTVQVTGDLPGTEQSDFSIFDPTSHDTVLPDVAAEISSENVLSGFYLYTTVYAYADPVLLNSNPTLVGSSFTYPPLPTSTGGVLTQTGSDSYSLDFGTITISQAISDMANVIAVNTVGSDNYYSDDLSGSLSTSGSGFIFNAQDTSNNSAGAGSFIDFGSISPNGFGANTLTITFSPTSTDPYSSTNLDPITLTVTDDVVLCFASGTRITTTKGEIRIEDVAVGDVLKAYASSEAAVQWIGHRRVNCRRHPKPQEVWPVRVRTGAFGKGKPRSDLWLSPEHSIFAEGVLIPIRYLINGTTVVQEPRDEVTYWVVELPRHDLVMAEGLLCESYLDAGHRNAFMVDRGPIQMHPTFSFEQNCEALWESKGFAPLRIHGAAVAKVAAQLRRRAKVLGFSAKGQVRTERNILASEKNFTKLFRPSWYLERESDVAAAGVDAATHYIEWGRQEGRMPCGEFELLRALQVVDPATVVFTMSDVIRAGVDPVVHFCEEGWRERRNPNPYFDTGWYLDTHHVPEGTNPLLHYLLIGEEQGMGPSKHFDPVWYRKRYAIDPMESPLAHYLEHRRSQLFSPLPFFDVTAYCKEHSSTLLPDRDPYAHYMAIGQLAANRESSFGRAAA